MGVPGVEQNLRCYGQSYVLKAVFLKYGLLLKSVLIYSVAVGVTVDVLNTDNVEQISERNLEVCMSHIFMVPIITGTRAKTGIRYWSVNLTGIRVLGEYLIHNNDRIMTGIRYFVNI